MKRNEIKNTQNKRSYAKPQLQKHGLLSKLTLKSGSSPDAFGGVGTEI